MVVPDIHLVPYGPWLLRVVEDGNHQMLLPLSVAGRCARGMVQLGVDMPLLGVYDLFDSLHQGHIRLVGSLEHHTDSGGR